MVCLAFPVSLNESVCSLKRNVLQTGVAQEKERFLAITGADSVSSRHFQLTLWQKHWHLGVVSDRLPK